MLVTTIDHMPGYHVSRILGEVIGLTVRMDNKYAEGIQDLDGHNETRINQLLATRREAIERMVGYADQLGANAIVGMRFDHRSIAGDYNEIVAYGTGVVVVPMADSVI